MTVGEMIALLQRLDQDLPLVVPGQEGGYDDALAPRRVYTRRLSHGQEYEGIYADEMSLGDVHRLLTRNLVPEAEVIEAIVIAGDKTR